MEIYGSKPRVVPDETLSDCSGMSWDVELDDNVDTKWTGIVNDCV